jgi:aminoglycoside/choline kinase family phosphotransferase
VVSSSFDAVTRARAQGVWADRQDLLQALERLPAVLCHNDLHRRNLLLPDGNEVVAVDWAFCGPGPAGSDLADLVWGTLYYGDADVDQASAVENAALEGYVQGLRDGGWDGPHEAVRLAYLLATALRWAALLPGWLAYFSDPEVGADVEATFGRPLAQLRPVWLTLCSLTLDRADHARTLHHP